MAMATLFQLQDQLSDTPEGLPCGSIQDSPDFGWRGMMVDVGRYHYPMKEIYNFVDAMHYYKYNVLHLHLTEDQGWRLPVPGYDKLRTIGAVRPSAPENQNNSLLANEGMYTKKELQDLVAYCKARGIQVLPEVEMPGPQYGPGRVLSRILLQHQTGPGMDARRRFLQADLPAETGHQKVS